MNRILQACIMVVIIAGFMVAVVSTAVTYEVTRQTAPVGSHADASRTAVEERTFRIEAGETIDDITHKLWATGFIRTPRLFRFLAGQRRLSQSMQPGTYRLRPNMSMTEIIDTLQQGPIEDEDRGSPDAPTD